jgi:hypothetical protein
MYTWNWTQFWNQAQKKFTLKNVLELESKDLKFEGIKFKRPLGEPPNKLCNVQIGIGGSLL